MVLIQGKNAGFQKHHTALLKLTRKETRLPEDGFPFTQRNTRKQRFVLLLERGLFSLRNTGTVMLFTSSLSSFSLRITVRLTPVIGRKKGWMEVWSHAEVVNAVVLFWVGV